MELTHSEIIDKYAKLLTSHCLDIRKNQKVYIVTTTLGIPLLKAVYTECVKIGAHVETKIVMEDEDKIYYSFASDEQMDYENPITKLIMTTFDAYLYIRAPYENKNQPSIEKAKIARKNAANAIANKAYSERTASGVMKRSLCQYPTLAAAQEADMTLEEYSDFVFNSCKLYETSPLNAWQELGKKQQKVVELLNTVDELRYVNTKSDIKFSVKGRTWINSDGKANMPSGEVYSGPIEDSVNGVIHFDYPSIYSGTPVQGITLHVVNGEVVKWHAELGQELLDEIFQIDGAKYFGEVAIGTNYTITRATKNILFDEKIGGTIHMAIGQSYYQTGGKNDSAIHWDMIAGMRDGGQIFADGKLIYENGYFLDGLDVS